MISFYMTFANLLGLLFDATNLILTLFVFAVISLAAAFLQKYKIASALMLLLLFAIPAIIPISVINILILIPPTAYLIYDVIARLRNKHPSIDYSRMFVTFVIIFLPFVLILATFGAGYTVRTMMIPFGFTFFLSTVTLLRAARHKEEVLGSKVFHFLNFLTPLLLLCGGFLLSTNFVGNILSFILRSFFLYIARPLALALIWVLSWIVYLISLLIPFRGSMAEMGTPDFPSMMIEEDAALHYYGEAATIPWFVYSILILIFIAICVFVLIKIFRSMNYRLSSLSFKDNEHETRRRLEDSQIITKKRRRSTGNQIRDIYYDYLRLCKKQGVSIKPYMTSEDVCVAAAENANEEPHQNLRLLYINSRYGEYEYSKSDLQRAKQLYRDLQKEMKKDP